MKKFEIFSTEDCKYCRLAKDMLARQNLAYKEYLLDKKPEKYKEYYRSLTGNDIRSVPQIFLDGEFIGGYHDLQKYLMKNG
jgi:glutaredoxin